MLLRFSGVPRFISACEKASVLMLRFHESSKLGIGDVEVVFLLTKKTSNISFYISFVKWEGN